MGAVHLAIQATLTHASYVHAQRRNATQGGGISLRRAGQSDEQDWGGSRHPRRQRKRRRHVPDHSPETRCAAGAIVRLRSPPPDSTWTLAGCWSISRYDDPYIGRFPSADTTIPGSPPLTVWPRDAPAQDLNRSAYTLNNPLTYTNPTGHCLTYVVSGRSFRKVLPRLDGVGHPPVGLQ